MKKKVEKLSGVFIIVVGLILVVLTLIVHFSYVDKMNNLLSSRVITSDSNDDKKEKSKKNDSSLVDFTIEGLGEDQKVADIRDGIPVICIPSLDIKVPVINGTDKDSLKLGAGKFDNSVEMGEVGNFCVAGHSSTVYNCIFNDLESIKTLDEIDCIDANGVLYKYYVTDTFKTTPDNIGVTYSSNERTMTIVTCTDGGVSRFIVVAKLMSDDELASQKRKIKKVFSDKAISISDEYSDIDILSFLRNDYSSIKIPYSIDYSCLLENTDSFFTNYILSEDKLKMNKHKMDIVFNQTVGFDFSSFLSEVYNSDV